MRVVLLALVFAAACSEAGRPLGPELTPTTSDWAPSVPLGEPAPNAPFDPRLVRLDPTRYAGSERLCDLSYMGSPGESPDPAVAERRLVRCATGEGAGWADLVFPIEAAELTEYVRLGDRIRVRVEPEFGRDGHPTLTFVANVETTSVVEPPELEPPVATSFRRVAVRDDREVHTCAISWIAPVERLRPEDEYPEGMVVHAPTLCRDDEGESWIDLAFPEVTQSAALRLRRGVVVPARLLDPSGGRAGHPIVGYEGP